jgi:hypothetical protein
VSSLRLTPLILALLLGATGLLGPEPVAKARSPLQQRGIGPFERWIFFVSTRDGGDSDIFRMRRDGSNQVNLTAGSAAEDVNPALPQWGYRRVIFTSTRDGGDTDVFAMKVDGSHPTNLTPDSPGEDRGPELSGHAGQLLSFSSDRDGDFDIWRGTIARTGTGDEQLGELVNLTDECPGQTPSSERAPDHLLGHLLLSTDRYGGDRDLARRSACGFQDNDSLHSLFLDSAETLPANSEGIDDHPDGYLFESDRSGGDLDVFWRRGVDGAPVTNLTADSAGFDGLPAASPANRQLTIPRRFAFISDRQGGDRDVLLGLLGGGSSPVNVTASSAASDDDPAWEYAYRCDGRPATIVGYGPIAVATLPPRNLQYPQGTQGADVIYGREPRGRGGRDVICLAPARYDRAWGGPGDDRIFSNYSYHDTLRGGAGGDVLVKREDYAEFRGGPGRDILLGKGKMFGGPGMDRCLIVAPRRHTKVVRGCEQVRVLSRRRRR